jgi:hypothetical protein
LQVRAPGAVVSLIRLAAVAGLRVGRHLSTGAAVAAAAAAVEGRLGVVADFLAAQGAGAWLAGTGSLACRENGAVGMEDRASLAGADLLALMLPLPLLVVAMTV